MHTLTRSRPRRRTWIGIDHSTKNNRALIHKVDMSQLLSSFTVVPFWSLFFSSQLKSVFLLFYSRPPTLGTTLYGTSASSWTASGCCRRRGLVSGGGGHTSHYCYWRVLASWYSSSSSISWNHLQPGKVPAPRGTNNVPWGCDDITAQDESAAI